MISGSSSVDYNAQAKTFADSVTKLVTSSKIRGIDNDISSESPTGQKKNKFTVCLPCCFCVGGGDKKNNMGVILLTIGVVFSFFVMLRFTFKSLAQYIDCANKFSTAKTRIKSLPKEDTVVFSNFVQPPQSMYNFSTNPNAFSSPATFSQVPQMMNGSTNYGPQFVHPNAFLQTPTAPSFNSQSSTNPFGDGSFNHPLYPAVTPNIPLYNPVLQRPRSQTSFETAKKTYECSQIILRKLKTDSKYTTLFQATVTLGCGLLTVALVITFLIEAEFLVMTLAVSGGGAVVIGAIGWGLKYAFIKWDDNEKDAFSSLQFYSQQLVATSQAFPF